MFYIFISQTAHIQPAGKRPHIKLPVHESAFHLVGPGQDAAQVVQVVVTHRLQLGRSHGAALGTRPRGSSFAPGICPAAYSEGSLTSTGQASPASIIRRAAAGVIL